MILPPPRSTRTYTLFPYTTLFRSLDLARSAHHLSAMATGDLPHIDKIRLYVIDEGGQARSDVWVIHSTGNSVYVAPRKLGGALKLSLHPSRSEEHTSELQ